MPTAPAIWQRLLRLRQNLERQEELKLATASRHFNAAVVALHEARNASHGDRCALLQRMQATISAAELQVAAVQHDAALFRQRRLESDVTDLGEKRERQQAVLIERTRAREVLEAVQARQANRQRRDDNRREQGRTDETFLMRRNGPSAGAKK